MGSVCILVSSPVEKHCCKSSLVMLSVITATSSVLLKRKSRSQEQLNSACCFRYILE